jgi:hypothetical protein
VTPTATFIAFPRFDPVTVVIAQPRVAEVLSLGPPKAGDAGLLNRELLRWATPLGLGYGGMGLVLAVLRSLRAGVTSSADGSKERGSDREGRKSDEG